MHFLTGLGLLSLAVSSYALSQSVLGLKQPGYPKTYAQSAPYDDGVFTPVEHLSTLSVDSFTTLDHPYFPNHSVRIKKTIFCDGTVKSVAISDHSNLKADVHSSSYTGYIDIEARHIFFYFFESRNDPTTDDVIFWTNGGKSSLRCKLLCRITIRTGPGCSSSLGLFMELGPCRALSGNGTTYHPEAWNTNANIFFVDQPIGVGFSYADYGEAVVRHTFGWRGALHV